MSLLDQASLVLVPSAYRTGEVLVQKPLPTKFSDETGNYDGNDPQGSANLTFTRNSNASRVNADGKVERVRTNLALYSQSFTNAVYGPKAGTFTDNYGTAPDGTQTACRWVSTNSDPFIYQPIAVNGTYTASVWIKGVVGYSGKNMSIRIGGALNYVSLTNEWQRVSVTSTQSSTINCGIEAPEGAAVGDEVLIWGFQVEATDFGPTDYIPTTSAAVSVGPTANVPRLNYSNGCPSLLLEPQRTNLVTYSEQLDHASWSKGGATVLANQVVSPDGYTNADKVTIPSGGTYYVYKILSGFSAGNVTLSCWAKADTPQVVGFNDGNAYQNSISLTTEWQRFTFTFNYTGAGIGIQFDNYFGVSPSNQAKEFYVWGCQAEQGSYATSYIPTLGASVTRLADAAYKTGISSLIGQTEGTIFFEFESTEDAPQNMNLINFNNSTQASVLIAKRTTGALRAQVFAGGSSLVDINSDIVSGVTKAAFAYKSGDSVLYVNGTAYSNSSTFTFGAALSEVRITAAEVYFNFPHKFSTNQALLFKTRLSNADLANLTAL